MIPVYGYDWDLWALYHKCTFDGLAKTITVNPGVTELDIKVDVYSDWKEWFIVDGSKYDEAIRSTGGDPTGPSTFTGDIYFLINNWKLLYDPREVAVTGVLFSDDYDTAFYFDQDGSALYPASVASIVNTYEIAAATSAVEVANEVWDRSKTSHTTANTMGSLQNELAYIEKAIYVNTDLVQNGDGSHGNPFNLLNTAIDYAEAEGLRDIYLLGDVTLLKNARNVNIIGIGNPEFDANGFNLKGTQLKNLKFKGEYVGSVRVEHCTLLTGAYLNGIFENCALDGDLTCANNAEVYMVGSSSDIPGTGRPTIDMGAGGTAQISVRDYNGGLTVLNCNQTTDRITVGMNSGSVTFDSSCIDGVMVVRGVGEFVDNTAGATVVNEVVSQTSIASAVWDYTE